MQPNLAREKRIVDHKELDSSINHSDRSSTSAILSAQDDPTKIAKPDDVIEEIYSSRGIVPKVLNYEENVKF